MNKYIPDTNITYDDFLELDNQLYKIKHEKSILEKENKQLKEETKRLKMIVYGLDNRDLFPPKICEYINKIEEEMNWEEYLKFQGDSNE